MELLDEAQCWELLKAHEVGRLAMTMAGECEIFPMNYVVYDGTVLVRTAEGTKLASLSAAMPVAFEIDGYDPASNEAWSVVLKGRAEVLQRLEEIYAAEDLPLFPWNIAPKHWFVRLHPRRLEGRRFSVVERSAYEDADD